MTLDQLKKAKTMLSKIEKAENLINTVKAISGAPNATKMLICNGNGPLIVLNDIQWAIVAKALNTYASEVLTQAEEELKNI